MAIYGFDFIDAEGAISSIAVGDLASALDATREARTALHFSLTAVAVDVWCGESKIARLRRVSRFSGGAASQRLHRSL